uniref:Uncharacterized protein n=1 Tax=Fomitiporia mediterranea TaxID=208960 RepID=A0A5B9RB87_9AGAM|nr:hypothetical protein Fomme_000104 [Fomitiporia mediterranea]QEG57114.1 hypothetical protein Fomme_000104 [Fomitiporia mediterranea]
MNMIYIFIILVVVFTIIFIAFNVLTVIIICLGYLGIDIQPYLPYYNIHFHVIWFIYLIYSLIAIKFAYVFLKYFIEDAYVVFTNEFLSEGMLKCGKIIILITNFLKQKTKSLLEYIIEEEPLLKLIVTFFVIKIVYKYYYFFN